MDIGGLWVAAAYAPYDGDPQGTEDRKLEHERAIARRVAWLNRLRDHIRDEGYQDRDAVLCGADVSSAEMGRLMKSEREFAERTGGIRYDAPAHGALMERARALDAAPGLIGGVREAVDIHLRYDERVGRDRERVGGLLEQAAGVVDARRELDARAAMRSGPAEQLPGWDALRKRAEEVADEANALTEEIPQPELSAHLAFFGAAPDNVEKKEKEIREQIARAERARTAAEAQRRAAEQARAAE